MSNNQMKVAKGMLASERPIVFAEKKPVPGKGGKAFKSLTAAVKAAEREKELARAYKLATEEVLEACCGRLREMEGYVRRTRRVLVCDAVCTLLMVGTLVVYMWVR